MKNKLLSILILFVMIMSVALNLGSCAGDSGIGGNTGDNSSDSGNNGGNNSAGEAPSDNGKEDQTDSQIRAIYASYVEYAKANSILPQSYDEWLDSIKGAPGANGITPSIGANGNWWIGDTDTGVKAEAESIKGDPGANGITPSIGANGNWWIGDTDTGVKAEAESLDYCVHNYSGWKLVSSSHSQCEMLLYAECTVCKDIDFKLEGDGHDYGDWNRMDSSCLYFGCDYRVCAECCDVEIKNYVDPLGHQWASEYEHDDSYHWYECDRCGTKKGTEEHSLNQDGVCTECTAAIKESGVNHAYIYDGSEVTITFYHTMGRLLQSVLEDAIADFNEIYPNITVEHESLGDYDGVRDQIQNEILAGNPPNLAYCYPEHVVLYNDYNAVVPLNDLISATATITDALGNESVVGLTQEQIDDFISCFYREGSAYDSEGTMYSLPFFRSTEALYYNKTFFDQHGLAVPTTWEEMEEVCKRILEIDPTCVPLGYDSEANWFINMCEQYANGEESLYTSLDKDNHFLFDNEVTRSFVERFADWYNKGYVVTMETCGAYTSSLFTATSGEKKCYMTISSTAGATYNTPPRDTSGNPIFETALAPIPQVDASNPKVIAYQGPSLCILNNENPQEIAASWLFVKYLTTSADIQAKFSMASGYTPVIKSVENVPEYREWLDSANGYDNLSAMSVSLSLSQENAYFSTPAFHGASAAREQVGLILVKVFSDRSGKDIKEIIEAAFKLALEECNAAADL